MDYETRIRSVSDRIANEVYDYPTNKEPASDIICWVVSENQRNDRVDHSDIMNNVDAGRTKVDKILKELYEADVFQPAQSAMSKTLVVPSVDGLEMVLNSGDLSNVGDDEVTDPEELATGGEDSEDDGDDDLYDVSSW